MKLSDFPNVFLVRPSHGETEPQPQPQPAPEPQPAETVEYLDEILRKGDDDDLDDDDLDDETEDGDGDALYSQYAKNYNDLP